jgi:hypothetical protein
VLKNLMLTPSLVTGIFFVSAPPAAISVTDGALDVVLRKQAAADVLAAVVICETAPAAIPAIDPYAIVKRPIATGH